MMTRYFILFFALAIVSCKTRRLDYALKRHADYIDFIIKDIEDNYSSEYFADSKVISIIKIGENEYEAYRKSYLKNLAVVVPDTSDYFINAYQQKEDKIYFYRSNVDYLLPSKVFQKMKDYGVELDSCSYFFKYETKNLYKYEECVESKSGGSILTIERSLYYNFSVDSIENRTRFKRSKLSKR